MKQNYIYNPFGKFVLRTPLLSIDKIRQLFDNDSICDDFLKELCRIPFMREALFLASPSFYREVEKWLNDKMPSQKEKDKVMFGVIRYYARMSTRCTPFGMFAGISAGNIVDENKIELKDIENNRLHIRLDMNYICALAQDLAKNETVKNIISFFPNDSCYRIGEKLRYVEYSFTKAKRQHHISAVDNSPYLQKVLDAAKNGDTLQNLANTLVNNEISPDEAICFINEMIESQLLVSELEPTVIGNDPLEQIIETLSKYIDKEEIKIIIEKLEAVDKALKILRTEKFVHDIADYENIKNLLSAFSTQYDEKFLFQADMTHKTSVCEISKSLTDNILDTIDFLNSINKESENENLRKFMEAFYERYEDEEMPLTQVLDTEIGIGYIQNVYSGVTPLVDDLFFPNNINSNRSIRLDNVSIVMQQKLSEVLATGSKIIQLDRNDFPDSKSEWNNNPETISAFIQLIDSNNYYLRSAGGSSAANLIGRFCHIDPDLSGITKNIILKDEKKEDCIYAEIVHLPESRVGNILHRPTIRKFEIPYLAHSSLPPENRITLDDLMISVRNNKIRLRSKKFNKTVVPRLTTAHNYSFGSLPAYHFLCDMQTYGQKSGLGFSWGFLHDTQKHLPRVVYHNAILALECWNFSAKDMSIINEKKDIEERADVFQNLVKDLNINKEVLLEDGDNELYFNLGNRMSILILLDLVKKRSGFTLQEFIFCDGKGIVKNGSHIYADEMLIPFYKKGDSS